MSVYELQMPLIPDSGRTAYGGDQEWCTNAWHRRSGCGPTTGVNLSVWYAKTRPDMRSLYHGDPEHVTREAFAKNIESMFRFITPGFMGFPYAEKFVSRYCAFAHANSVNITGACCDKSAPGSAMFDFVRSSIDHGDPVPMLILRHHAPALADDNWHWVTVSGYTDGADGRCLIASNCGERDVWDADMVFEKHPGTTVRLLRFCTRM